MGALPGVLQFSEEQSEKKACRLPRLLIVDDVAENRDLLARRFGRRNYEIEQADGGVQALSLIDAGAYDAILLDVMMPDMNGLEVLRRIRSKFPAEMLPVIMVTGKTQREDIVTALETGANDYVTKPVDFAIALARVAGQVDRKFATENLSRTIEALRLANDQLQHEIASRQRLEERTEYLKNFDVVTGVGNRTLLKERLSQAISYAERQKRSLSVVCLDLDNFRIINDGLGYAAGDKILQTVAQRLAAGVRDSDTLVRLGGDEFAFILLDQPTSSDPIAALIGRIQTIVSEGIVVEKRVLTLTCSVGVSTYPDDGKDSDTLLANANIALSRAKTQGCGGCQTGVQRSRPAKLRAASGVARRVDQIRVRSPLPAPA